MKEKKFRKDQLVVLTTDVGGCNCSVAKEGTIAKIMLINSNRISVKFYEHDGYNKISSDNIRPLKPGVERSTAKKLFNNATSYKHATIY